MKKIIKKWGKGLGIYFSQEEIKVHHLVEGEVVALTLTKEIHQILSKRFKPSPKEDNENQ